MASRSQPVTPVFRSSGDILVDRRHAWAQASLDAGDAASAADLFAQAVEMAPDWTPGWFGLGEARLALDERNGAHAAFARCLVLEPGDGLGAGLRLAKLGADAGPPGTVPAMSPAFVRGLFDGYAERFDTHLTGDLAYCGPRAIMSALADAPKARPWPRRFAMVLDLGCGTGLMGAEIRPHADHLAGCDLSPAMLEKARAKGLYDRLSVADVVDFLAQEAAAAVDLVLAADVFVYVGDLAPVMRATAGVLTPGGLAAFTVQAHAGSGYALGEDMRYGHSPTYLHEVTQAAGLSVRRIAAASTRLDRGEPVPGLVVVLEKADEKRSTR